MTSKLKVNIIADSGDNALITSDGSGNITSQSVATNTPNFYVRLSGNFDLTNDTWTKIPWDTEQFDTDNAFASNKFTVPSGEGGKYLFYGSMGFNSNALNDISYADVAIYKNGSAATAGPRHFLYNDTTGFVRSVVFSYTGVLTLAADDYIEVYGRIDDVNGSSMVFSGRSFAGHKLIGV